MSTAHDFVIGGDPETGTRILGQALEELGYSISIAPNGAFVANRGSTAATVLWGGLAGKKFRVTLTVQFLSDAGGALVARLDRNMAAGAVRGGALGAAKTNSAFQEAADAIGHALSAAGALTSHGAR